MQDIIATLPVWTFYFINLAFLIAGMMAGWVLHWLFAGRTGEADSAARPGPPEMDTDAARNSMQDERRTRDPDSSLSAGGLD